MRKVLADRIVSDPETMGGVPIIEGTRVPVYVILENLGVGRSADEILAEYPTLSAEDIRAAAQYAAAAALTTASSRGCTPAAGDPW